MNVKRAPEGVGFAALAAMIACIASPSLAQPIDFGQTRTYRLDADFDEGLLVNVNHDAPFNNQLQLNSTTIPFPFINIAASGRGTIIRIDVNTGQVLGEYRSAPQGRPTNPSRTTVDLFGNVWSGNRDEGDPGSIVKVGLIIGGTRGIKNADGSFSPSPTGEYLAPPFQYSTCIDRNADGLIRTSRGLGNILAWVNVTDVAGGAGGGPALVEDAQDECILVYQRLPGCPNARHVSVDANNDVWVGGYPFDMRTFRKLDGDTGQFLASFNAGSIGCGGYGGLVDGNGILWSASISQNRLLRYNPATNTGSCLGVTTSYGLGIDTNGFIWNAMWTNNRISKISPAGVMQPGFPRASGGSSSRGVAVTPFDNNVWVANSGSNNVSRLDNNGNLRKTIPVGATPTGVAVDSNGKVWVTNYDSHTVMRINPAGGADGLGAVDLTVNLQVSGLASAFPYNYSDMTGTVVIGSTAPQGTWTVVYDGGFPGVDWSRVSWTSAEPAGTNVTVEVRAADDELNLSLQPFRFVSNAVSLAGAGIVGQFIEIRATLSKDGNVATSPILYDLTVSSSSGFSDITLDADVGYRNTTFNRAFESLLVDARAQNIGTTPIDAPLLMVIDSLEQEQLALVNPDGFTAQDTPYIVTADLDQPLGGVASGDFGPTRTLVFDNPLGEAMCFDPSWLAPTNQPPFFTSAAPGAAVVARQYSYTAVAEDPNGHAVTYDLLFAPVGMTIDSASGDVTWTPSGGQVGSHSVNIEAVDGRGGSATQFFTVEVFAQLPNRPPVFVSTPPTQVDVADEYEYQAAATDPDSDALLFNKLDGPAGLSVSAAGLVHWPFALPGDYQIALRVADGLGGYADQKYLLTVGESPTNPHAPTLAGTPPTIGAVNQVYVYQPIGSDPDPADVLAFSLPTAPSGMQINTATGRVTWTPTASQVGMHAVVLEVTDGHGGFASQAWGIDVFTTPPNRAPVITSVPGLITTVGEAYQYQVQATDPEGSAVSYSLVSPPPGMQIGQSSGLLTYAPSDSGAVIVAIRAADPQGAAGSQVFELQVLPPNVAPEIVSTPVDVAVVGGTYRYDVDAVDANGDELSYALTDGPQGMYIDSITGLVSWVPTPGQVGGHAVTVGARDARNGSAGQSYNVTVTADTTPPVVDIFVSADPAFVDEPVEICVDTSDDGVVIERTLDVDGVTVELDDFACTVQVFTQPTIVVLDAAAVDGGDNVGITTRNLQVVDPNDPTAPEIVLVGPAPGTTFTSPAEIIASITDNTPATLMWEVRVSREDESGYRVLNTGTGEVVGSPVAVFDTTMLSNDTYNLTIVANDGVHQSSLVVPYSVAGELKLGNFKIAFTDLAIPVAGIPLVITREYDSLDTATKDFGAGWRLDLPGKVTDSAKESPVVEPCTPATRVYVTRPDGRRVGFTFQAAPISWLFPFIVNVTFRPDQGVFDSLSLPGNPSAFISGGQLFDGLFIEPFNPSTYILATQQGVKYTIDEQVGLQSVVDRNGNTLTVTPSGIVSSTGISLAFDRDVDGRITRIVEPDDPLDPDEPGELHYSYDALGNLVSFEDESGEIAQYFYEHPQFPHYLTRIEDSAGNAVLRNVYNGDGRLIAQCGPDGDIVTLEGCGRLNLDPTSTVQTVVDARGFRTDFVLDPLGNVLTERRYLEDGVTVKETHRTYVPGTDLVLTETDPEGSTLSWTYDDRGNLLTASDAAGNTTHFTYDCCHVTSITDPLGHTQTMSYDANGNLERFTDAAGEEVQMTYDSAGRLIEAMSPTGHPTQFVYGQFPLPDTLIHDDGASRSFSYNDAGQLTEVIDEAGGRVTLTYDAAGRLTAFSDHNGNSMIRAYENGNLVSLTAPGGDVTTYEYDSAGRLIRETDPNQGITEYTYDAVGNRTSVEDPVGNLTTFEYDTENLVRAEVTSAGSKTVEYNGSKKPTRLTDRLGRVREFGYDLAGNLSTESWYSSTGQLVGLLEYEYDDNGNLLRAADANSALVFSYDVVNRLSQADFSQIGISQVFTLQYTYDAAGNVTQIADNAGVDVTSTYNSRSHLTERQWQGPGVDGVTVKFGYDPAGRAVSQRRYCGLMEEDLAAATSADYTSTGRPSFLEERTGNGDLLSRADYTYDARSRLTSEARGGTSLTFDYDGLNQLTSVTKNGATTSYTYDAAGNRIGGSYLVDAGNQIVQDACCNYLYDAEGNLVERTERASGDVTRFTFDHRNRLMEATRQSGGAVVQVVAFEYDALDRRISVAVDADGDGPLSLARTAFVHDGEHLWAELASDGAVIARYLHGDILDQVLALYTPSEGVAWYLTDEIGTVHDVVDCSASLLNHIDYDAFGDVLTESDAGVGRRFRFAGRDWDAETRLYFFRTRYYDPYLGRFISTDRLGFDGGDANLYRFGNNSPTNLRDPRGTAVFASYAIRLRILLARVAIIRCLGFAVFTNLGEAGIYVLLTSISGGSNVYVGSTVNFAVRFYQHSSSGVGGRGLTIISQIPIRISEAVARNPQLLRTAEQLVINAFGGKAQLLNIRNASRILFCR